MNITFTLTSQYSGITQSGDYNISGTTSGGALNQVFIASGITKAQLTTGYTAISVSDSVTGGTITSTGSASGGVCTNQIFWEVNSDPGPGETVRLLTQVTYINIASGDVITITNDTPGGTTNTITSVNGVTVYGSNRFFVDSVTGTTVTFTVQKTTGNGGNARDVGSIELMVNSTSIDVFNFSLGDPLNGTVSGHINDGDSVVINIFEG